MSTTPGLLLHAEPNDRTKGPHDGIISAVVNPESENCETYYAAH